MGLIAPRSAGFVGSLCMALAHKWKPESLFVILTTYIDESGTHQGSPATVMGGFIATAELWNRYQIELDILKRQYGFRIIHATDLKSGKNEFAGWPARKRASLFMEIGRITENSALMEGFTFTVSNDE